MSGRFAAYGPSHWAALVLFAIGCAGLIMLGRGQTSSEAKGFSRAFSLAIAYVVIGVQAYTVLPSHWSIGGSLPLQLCDLAWVVAIPALWTRNRRWFALSYYWCLTLSVQSLLTPALDGSDYPDIDYLNFFGPHLLVVWTAVYLTWGLGMRPDWGSYRFAAAVTATWAVATFVFNSIAGTNYGFLNRKPGTGSALDLLGPWPWYVLAEVAIILAGWALITWPWTRARGPDDADPVAP